MKYLFPCTKLCTYFTLPNSSEKGLPLYDHQQQNSNYDSWLNHAPKQGFGNSIHTFNSASKQQNLTKKNISSSSSCGFL